MKSRRQSGGFANMAISPEPEVARALALAARKLPRLPLAIGWTPIRGGPQASWPCLSASPEQAGIAAPSEPRCGRCPACPNPPTPLRLRRPPPANLTDARIDRWAQVPVPAARGPACRCRGSASRSNRRRPCRAGFGRPGLARSWPSACGKRGGPGTAVTPPAPPTAGARSPAAVAGGRSAAAIATATGSSGPGCQAAQCKAPEGPVCGAFPSLPEPCRTTGNGCTTAVGPGRRAKADGACLLFLSQGRTRSCPRRPAAAASRPARARIRSRRWGKPGQKTIRRTVTAAHPACPGAGSAASAPGSTRARTPS